MADTNDDRRPSLLRRVLPWVIAFGAVQVAARLAGRAAASRLDTGDEDSADLRRVRTMDQISLRPTSQQLSTMRFDLLMAGLELDLTEARPAPGGADVWLNCTLAGGNIRVPRDWSVAADCVGLGGVGSETGEALTEHADPAAADLRIHLRARLGGVGVTH